MSPNDDNLGPPSEWQIRRFPSGLREQVVAEAKREGMPVAEFLTAVLIVAREAGWPRAVDAVPRLQTAANGTALAPVDALGGLIAAAVTVAQAQTPRARARLLAAAARCLTARLTVPR